MNTVKQGEDDGLCVAACIAMITGETLEEVVNRTRTFKGMVLTDQCIIALAQKRFTYGYTIDVKDVDLSRYRFKVTVDLRESPAILTVNSQRFPGTYHCVVWDNKVKMVRDPNPYLPLVTPITDYEVVEWVPIGKISETC